MVPLVNAGSPFRDSSEESRPSEMPPPVDEGINDVLAETVGSGGVEVGSTEAALLLVG